MQLWDELTDASPRPRVRAGGGSIYCCSKRRRGVYNDRAGSKGITRGEKGEGGGEARSSVRGHSVEVMSAGDGGESQLTRV